MRIIVVGRDYPSKENNMTGSFEYEQAQMLARKGHDVYYIVLDLRSIRHRRKIGFIKTRRDGVNIVTLNVPVGRGLPASIRDKLYTPFRKYQLKILCRKYGVPDIVLVNYPSIFPYSTFIALQKRGVRIIGTEHWSKVQNQDLPDKNLGYLREFVNRADVVMCVSDALKKSLMELTGTSREIMTIPNSISPVFCYKKTNTDEASFSFLAVGRLSKEKGYDKLIQAFCNAFNCCNSIKLHIVGGGQEYKNLQEIILKNNAKSTILLHGVMERKELADFFHKCDVLVMPSDYETFGIPVAEAMACGLPVIVTRNSGVSHYVTNESGITIENNSIECVSSALAYMYDNYKKYNKQLISEYADNNFSEHMVYQTLKDIIDNAVKGKNNGK